MNLNVGEVWFVEFPYEEDPTIIKNRPVIVIDQQTLGVLSVKVTKHAVRDDDPYDTPILHWQEANLRLASTARISKVMLLSSDAFIFKIGNLHPDDLAKIQEEYIRFATERLGINNDKSCDEAI